MAYGKLLQIAGSRSSKRLPLLFECLLCHDKFTTEDVENKQFYPQTSICKNCYKLGQQTNSKVWCFGKLKRHNSPGYSSENVSCKLLCPDKRICKSFINKLKNKEK